MQRPAQEGYVASDRLSACQTADRLIDNGLKNGRRQILFCRAFVDQRLDIRFGEYAAARCNGVKRGIVFRIFVQPGSVCLQQGSHLVDKRTGSSCADAVHALLYVSVFKVNDLGVLAAKFDRHISLRNEMLQRGRHSDDLLHKRHFQMVCQCKSAGACNDRRNLYVTQQAFCVLDQRGESLLNICIVTLVIRK